MSAIHITAANFEEEVLHSDKAFLVDLWASWFAPCRMIAPMLEEIAAERGDIFHSFSIVNHGACQHSVDRLPNIPYGEIVQTAYKW